MGSGISRWFRREQQQSIPVEDIQQELDNFSLNTPQEDNIAKEEVPIRKPRPREDNIAKEGFRFLPIKKPIPREDNIANDDVSVDADQLIVEGRVQELMDAIMSDAEIRCQHEPVNYAARCGQFELVNWLMANNLTDLKI